MNKKGQSLVEVVVALGILVIVFSGVITLIIRVVDLELDARDRTSAVALAQKTLAETVGLMGDGCTDGAVISDTPETENIGGKDFTHVVNLSPSFDYGQDLNETNFQEVIVTITWKDKAGALRTYQLKQLVNDDE